MYQFNFLQIEIKEPAILLLVQHRVLQVYTDTAHINSSSSSSNITR